MDSVSTAFELMRLELEAAVDNLNSDGAALIRDSRYEDASKLIDRGKKLRDFCKSIEQLAEEWRTSFAEEGIDGCADIDDDTVARKILSASKSPRTGLLVRFPDGSLISERTAAQTLAKCIQKIGFEKVASLGIQVNSENIVSREQSKRYNDTQIAPYFIKTHSNTAQKKRNIEHISDELGLELEVVIV